jgi:cytochrome c-type biogenesis protein CcmE
MSRKLDQELADAIANKTDGDPPAMATPAAPTRIAPPRKKNLGLLAALLVMVGLLVGVFLKGFSSAAVYATTVDKLLASKSEYVGRKVRVEGELVPGTLVKREQPCEYRFTIHKDKDEMLVRYPSCVIPDTFRDMPGGGVQVTIEGNLTDKGDFTASLVMAKCASKYDPKTHQMDHQTQQANGTMPGTR